MKKNAFTMAEIVVSLVVMAVIASVVVPITRDKFEKIDYASYYLGYKVAQTIAKIEIPPVVKEEDELCKISENVCFSKGFYATPMTKSQCLAEKDSLGIKACCYDTDYWAGVVKACGGVQNLPTATHLAALADYLYGVTGTEPYEELSGVSMDKSKLEVLGLKYSYTMQIWSNEELAHNYTWVRRYMTGSSVWLGSSYGFRDYNLQGFCVTYKNQNSGSNGSSGSGSSSNNVTYTFDDFCKTVTSTLSGSQKDCTQPVAKVQEAVSSKDFSALPPHLVLDNGIKVYMASDYGEITQLDDSLDEADRIGFTVYIDVDGNKSKSRLYDDVFPFYLTKSGKVIPGYDSNIVAGANCEKNLAFDILYDEFDASGNRKLKRLDGTSIGGADMYSFKNAACISGYVKSQKYCGVSFDGSLTINGVNCKNDKKADCRIQVRKPLKIFR